MAQQLEKRIFILADGTWKDSISGNGPPTNVYRFSHCLSNMDVHGQREQIFIYQPGIGIASGGSALLRPFVTLAGGGFGLGMNQSCYCFNIMLPFVF
jgi:uncharacterized protein (DUF2235 family)